MKLARNSSAGMDFEFQCKFMDISSEYKEIDEEEPMLLCQASWATAEYINRNLPDGLLWDNEAGILIDRSDKDYSDHEIIEVRGEEYAVCPEAYGLLDSLLPAAIEHGLMEVFGHAEKYEI